ncbi:hypothetical protein [Halospeciosus flavus]|uniref:N-ATPase, AtpR subunit n=1 Tax=Halospeciosus flavus TaxID=3032283 RepID=A0ABD5Z1M9_9EURY|nr:hypothetical protein [Halospeciosus flavus]
MAEAWLWYFALMVGTAWVGYVLAREYDGVLRPFYERGSILLWLGRAVLVVGWLVYFAKMGSDGLLGGVVVAVLAGAYARFAATDES